MTTQPTPGTLGAVVDMTTQAAAFRDLLDGLPIYGTAIGYRDDATPELKQFGDALFDLHERWLELRRSLPQEVLLEWKAPDR